MIPSKDKALGCMVSSKTATFRSCEADWPRRSIPHNLSFVSIRRRSPHPRITGLVVALTLSAVLLSSGCIDAKDPAACPDWSFDDWRSLREAVFVPYARSNGTDDPDDRRNLGVMALRFSDPARLPEDEVPIDTFVEWSAFSSDGRPMILHDLLCASRWQVENIPTMTREPFWTVAPTSKWIADDAFDALRAEHLRQNGVDHEWCCYIRFQGEFYGTRILTVAKS
jgi:hypothetical protein